MPDSAGSYHSVFEEKIRVEDPSDDEQPGLELLSDHLEDLRVSQDEAWTSKLVLRFGMFTEPFWHCSG